MKNVLFLMTHLGSGWESFVKSLEQNPKIQFFGEQFCHHPNDLSLITRNPHKNDNTLAYWGGVILHNKDFSCRALCGVCSFIYLAAPPSIALENIPYSAESVAAYYRFRLRGMVGWFRRTGGVWTRSINEVYPDLAYDYKYEAPVEPKDNRFSSQLNEECKSAYEKYCLDLI